MKKGKTKRSIQQSAFSNRPNQGPKTQKRAKPRRGMLTLEDLRWPDQRVVRFPQVQGKTAESIELLSSPKYHHITVEFADRTSLSFAIEPAFVVKAAYEYFKRGKPQAKLWPDISSHKGSN